MSSGTSAMRVDNGDWFLQSIINLVNDSNLRVGIILCVNGLLVFGDLVGGHKYFKGFINQFVEGRNENINGERLRTSIKACEKIHIKDRLDRQEILPCYIHLQNARIFDSNGTLVSGSEGIWWRGRVSEISGFSLDYINADAIG
ncbi:hypothetical protein [uncultured Desulfosarcina sp.]|uniref:hypothetical protein n=1 Tax=uncultured Desulfosarcina sp. TaxID=218289 RepID=UPI0029C8D4BF|nr:hypothetical protein [uncultured Desulfosarcina sp.]